MCVCVQGQYRGLDTCVLALCVFVYVPVPGYADGDLSAPVQLRNSVSVSRVQFLRQCIAVELSGVVQVWNINVFSGLWVSLHEIGWEGVYMCVYVYVI